MAGPRDMLASVAVNLSRLEPQGVPSIGAMLLGLVGGRDPTLVPREYTTFATVTPGKSDAPGNSAMAKPPAPPPAAKPAGSPTPAGLERSTPMRSAVIPSPPRLQPAPYVAPSPPTVTRAYAGATPQRAVTRGQTQELQRLATFIGGQAAPSRSIVDMFTTR